MRRRESFHSLLHFLILCVTRGSISHSHLNPFSKWYDFIEHPKRKLLQKCDQEFDKPGLGTFRASGPGGSASQNYPNLILKETREITKERQDIRGGDIFELFLIWKKDFYMDGFWDVVD